MPHRPTYGKESENPVQRQETHHRQRETDRRSSRERRGDPDVHADDKKMAKTREEGEERTGCERK